MFNFLWRVATHTGSYGTGEAKLIDWSIFLNSIKKMVMKEFTFTLHLLFLIAGWIIIKIHKITGSPRRLYIGITLATTFQVLLVARNYNIHYMMPVFALVMPLHGYFWIQFFKQKFGAFSTRIVPVVMIVLVVAVFARLVVKNRFERGIINSVENTCQILKSEFKGTYIILTDNGNVGGAFIEPALQFGLGYSGPKIRPKYTKILASLYPKNYLWNQRNGFTKWEKSYLPFELFSHFSEIYIYERPINNENTMGQIKYMIDCTGMSDFISLKKVYENKKTNETIALAMIDTFALKQYYSKPLLTIITGMELLSPDCQKILSNDKNYSFNGGRLISEQCALSGQKSLLLTAAQPFGLDFSVPVSFGKNYKVEFWQKSGDKKQVIFVASASTSKKFYKTSISGENLSGEWTKCEFAFELPDDYPEDTIRFYLWNTWNDSIWVDDLCLKVFK